MINEIMLNVFSTLSWAFPVSCRWSGNLDHPGWFVGTDYFCCEADCANTVNHVKRLRCAVEQKVTERRWSRLRMTRLWSSLQAAILLQSNLLYRGDYFTICSWILRNFDLLFQIYAVLHQKRSLCGCRYLKMTGWFCLVTNFTGGSIVGNPQHWICSTW